MSAIRIAVTIPRAYMLWAPGVGIVLGTLGLSKGDAQARLSERRADGHAFTGERVRQIRVELRVQDTDGGVIGYVRQ